MHFKPFLKLIRLPNVLTAACNSLAGAFCGGVTIWDWRTLLPLALASMSLYAAGILLNDLFDLDEDRRERPQRPLPSGAVSIRLAASAAVVLSVAGCLLATSVSQHVGYVALALLGAVVGYDAGLKRTPAGPWTMGLCRGLNLGLGLAVRPMSPWGILAIIGYTFYIAGVTYISRQETHVGRTKGLSLGFGLIIGGVGFVLTAILLESNIHGEAGVEVRTPSLDVILGIFLLIVLLRMISKAWQAAMRDPRPDTIQQVVKMGIISLPLVDTAMTLGMAGLVDALPVIAIWIIARLTARKLYTT